MQKTHKFEMLYKYMDELRKIVKSDKIEVKQNIKIINFDKENIDKNQNKIKIKRF